MSLADASCIKQGHGIQQQHAYALLAIQRIILQLCRPAACCVTAELDDGIDRDLQEQSQQQESGRSQQQLQSFLPTPADAQDGEGLQTQQAQSQLDKTWDQAVGAVGGVGHAPGDDSRHLELAGTSRGWGGYAQWHPDQQQGHAASQQQALWPWKWQGAQLEQIPSSQPQQGGEFPAQHTTAATSAHPWPTTTGRADGAAIPASSALLHGHGTGSAAAPSSNNKRRMSGSAAACLF